MSAVQSESTLESKLDTLECHFTWDLRSSRCELLRLKDQMLDFGLEGNVWLGPIYNLQGFIHLQLGLNEEANGFFTKAAEVYAEQDPWRVVTYGNLAWLHHYQDKEKESQHFVEKVDELLKENPPPFQDELHPEVYAEKAWTLMKFNKEKIQLAIDYFQRAIRMQPDHKEWRTSRVLALNYLNNCKENKPDAEVLEEMRHAREEDPDNLFLAAVLLKQRAKNGENVEEEVEELTRRIMENPVNSYNGFEPLLNLHEQVHSVDEAIGLAEEALRKFPEVRYIKKCAARCYKRKILFHKKGRLEQDLIQRALTLHKDLIGLYPESLKIKIDLPVILSKSANGQHEAEQMYQKLLEEDLEPLDKQMLYYCYANYLFFERMDDSRSIHFNIKATKIPEQSLYRDRSIKKLEMFGRRGHRTAKEFLKNLKSREDQHAIDHFQRAISKQPDNKEWRTSRVLALDNLNNSEENKPDTEVLEEMGHARKEDPDNFFFAAVLLTQRAKNGENVEEEVEELTRRIMENLVNSYNGFESLLNLHEQVHSVDEAIGLAEEALRKFPEVRYIKKCAARCYKKKILFHKKGRLEQDLIQRALTLHKDLIDLYPESLKMKIDLALILSKSANGQHEAEQMYQKLLEEDLEPLDKQMLYHYYANYLFFVQKNNSRSIHFNIRAAKIPEQSLYRDRSIKTLEKLARHGNRTAMEFLRNLKSREDQHDFQEIQEEATGWRRSRSPSNWRAVKD
ncbi:interferon-induced protein with tetratricopeptide repeats 2-like [Gouania willdenowi]|uniref:interferon-induced protein with tetratricopeptide repeats 2-like n=1 Tax=Gouania willdenowi TaxID=441366 RepID=UPI001055B769|nr:interferon-induced protein with tetratricopeptide repeats 2-like [Gouania willdenowi]